MTICQPYLEKSNDSCSPERAPEKPYFTWYQWREKKAHLRGDVLMVHIKSDVAAAGLVNQDHRPSCLTSTWCADSLSNASLLTLTSVCVWVWKPQLQFKLLTYSWHLTGSFGIPPPPQPQAEKPHWSIVSDFSFQHSECRLSDVNDFSRSQPTAGT